MTLKEQEPTAALRAALDELDGVAAQHRHVVEILIAMLRGTYDDPDAAEDFAGYLEALLDRTPGQRRQRKAPIPPALRWRVWIRDDFRCHYCGDRYRLSLDHVVPESRGGPTTFDNLMTACVDCNTRKGTRRASAFVLDRSRP